jgi:hypothetical protein
MLARELVDMLSSRPGIGPTGSEIESAHRSAPP